MSAELDMPYAGAFRGREHYFALRVYIEDTDLGGVVYHANYLRFLERARSDLLRAVGIDQRKAIESGQGVYAVTELHIKYLRPARLQDDLLIISRLDKLRLASCLIAQQVRRGAETLAEASVKVAFLTPDGRPNRQPTEWLQKMQQFLE